MRGMGRDARAGVWAAALSAASCGDFDEAKSAGEDPELATGASSDSAAQPDPEAQPTSDDASDGSGEGEGSTGTAALGPPYPLVLAHGFFGFDEFAGVDFADYFYGVAPALAQLGETHVYTPAVDPFNDSTLRGQLLLDHIEEILASTGYDKVVIVGHSQGGLDARVVASLRPDLVAAVVTVATPHHGTPIADVTVGLIADPGAQSFIDALVNLVGGVAWETVDGSSSLAAVMEQLAQPGITAFNAAYPDAAGVRYLSIAGRSSLHSGGDACAVDNAPEFIARWSSERDPIDALFSGPAAYLTANIVDPVANDGLVRVQDAQWGEFLGCIPADHTDQIGQVFGDLPGLTNAWRHDDFWVALAQWIRSEGL